MLGTNCSTTGFHHSANSSTAQAAFFGTGHRPLMHAFRSARLGDWLTGARIRGRFGNHFSTFLHTSSKNLGTARVATTPVDAFMRGQHGARSPLYDWTTWH